MSVFRFGTVLLAGAATLAFSSTAHAAGASRQEKIDALQQQINDLNAEVADLKRSTSDQYTDVVQKQGDKPDVAVSLKNGRPAFKSADGDFSLEIRSLVQFDAAYYGQGKSPAGVDFSSGANFRRARLGVDGTLFKDWSYEFIYDFGGSGSEGSAISSAFIQYDGLGPLHWKIGAYAPPENFDDATSASDLLFLERAQPADLARGIAGADGRDATTIFAYDDNYFAALSYTGDSVQDSAVFDEQQALVGRFAYRLLQGDDSNLAIGVDSSYVFKIADTAAGAGSPRALRLRERPELNVDDNNIRLIDTGTINAGKVWEWGLEAAGNWHNLYAQGGYFGFDVERRGSTLPDPSFDGWYVQASWVLTGESKKYRADKGAYGLPTPKSAFSFDRPGIGAWELAARYSVLDLNDNAGVAGAATPLGGVRGGEQKIWTAGVNWYPNNAIRFVLDYQHTDVARLNAAGGVIGAKLDAVSLRAQFSL
jgi:phosphate-selective porin OprO/OprP